MKNFIEKASLKLSKLSEEQIRQILNLQTEELAIRNAVLDSSDDGFCLIDKELNVLFINKELCNIIGYSRKRNHSSIKVNSVFKNKSISSFIINTLNGKKEGSNIVEITTSQGKEKDYAIGSSPIDDFEGLMFTFRDITFLKKIREDYIRNESLAAMTTMAAGVAHEIKNPLASISIYLQLIEKEIEDKGSLSKETASLYLPIVSSEVERINTIAVDFLYAVKPMKVNLQQCNLNDIAKITCNLVEGELKEKGINLTLNLASSLPNIFADPSLMEQSILNLIKNAIQAFNEDVLYPSIIVSTFMDGEMAKLSVEDNGCGIAEENIGKIFEPYYTTKPSGSGLGLTVIFKIMKQHGGDITLTSTVGVGSVFTLQIPVPDEERFRIPFKG